MYQTIGETKKNWKQAAIAAFFYAHVFSGFTFLLNCSVIM